MKKTESKKNDSWLLDFQANILYPSAIADYESIYRGIKGYE